MTRKKNHAFLINKILKGSKICMNGNLGKNHKLMKIKLKS